MNKNKGFASVSLIIILVAVLAVGGIAYYSGKKLNTSVQVPEQPIVASNCTPATKPWITIISPNGGETYTAGQQITINWKSCNINQSVGITLSGFPYPSNEQFFLGDWGSGNSGTRTVTIPNSVAPGKFTLNISTPPESSPSADDWSDNLFMIQ